jgi:ferredoxin
VRLYVMCVCAFMFTVYDIDGDGELMCNGCGVCVCM